MARIAIVNCGIPNGLRLTLERHDDAIIQHVELAPGQNRIDPEFWEAWLAENEHYPPLVSGAISGGVLDVVDLSPVVEPEPESAEPEPVVEPAGEA